MVATLEQKVSECIGWGGFELALLPRKGKGTDPYQPKFIGSGACPPTHIFLTSYFVPASDA